MTRSRGPRHLTTAACLAVTLVLAACTGAPTTPEPASPPTAPTAPTASAAPTEPRETDPDAGLVPPTTAPPLTLEQLAPGLRRAAAEFTNPPPPLTTSGPALTVTVADANSPRQFSHANIGLSFEATDLADTRWDPDASYLDELVEALGQPTLRFGGNSVDRRVWWTSTDEPAPEWAEATVTPEDFERLGTFTEKTGATVTLVANLGRFDPERAADYVSHAHESLGDALVAVSIGNEPNGFALESQPQYKIRPDGYSPTDYVAELTEYAEAITAAVPDQAFAGPGAFDMPWLRAFGDAGLPSTAAITQHWYPLWSCDGSAEPRAKPTVDNLVSPWLHGRAEFIIGLGRQTALRYGKPLWMEEAGPTSCYGTNETSRTHAQALWTADFTLHAAALGVERLNHHGMIDACRGGAPTSPLCDTGELGSSTPVLRGQSNYLALLQLSALGKGPLREVFVSGDDRVFGYAVETEDGLDLVVVNLNDPESVGASPVTVTVPEGLAPTEASVLWADTLDVRNGTSLLPWSPLSAVPAEVNAGSVLAIRFTQAAVIHN